MGKRIAAYLISVAMVVMMAGILPVTGGSAFLGNFVPHRSIPDDLHLGGLDGNIIVSQRDAVICNPGCRCADCVELCRHCEGGEHAYCLGDEALPPCECDCRFPLVSGMSYLLNLKYALETFDPFPGPDYTVTLLRDYTTTEAIRLTHNRNITLDLNGFVLTMKTTDEAIALEVRAGNFTVIDTSEEQTGSFNINAAGTDSTGLHAWGGNVTFLGNITAGQFAVVGQMSTTINVKGDVKGGIFGLRIWSGNSNTIINHEGNNEGGIMARAGTVNAKGDITGRINADAATSVSGTVVNFTGNISFAGTTTTISSTGGAEVNVTGNVTSTVENTFAISAGGTGLGGRGSSVSITGNISVPNSTAIYATGVAPVITVVGNITAHTGVQVFNNQSVTVTGIITVPSDGRYIDLWGYVPNKNTGTLHTSGDMAGFMEYTSSDGSSGTHTVWVKCLCADCGGDINPGCNCGDCTDCGFAPRCTLCGNITCICEDINDIDTNITGEVTAVIFSEDYDADDLTLLIHEIELDGGETVTDNANNFFKSLLNFFRSRHHASQ
jgi:hypothetical protein